MKATAACIGMINSVGIKFAITARISVPPAKPVIPDMADPRTVVAIRTIRVGSGRSRSDPSVLYQQ